MLIEYSYIRTTRKITNKIKRKKYKFLLLEVKRPLVLIIDEPQFTQTIFPPNDLSEINLLLPHEPHILFLAICIYKVNKQFSI